MERRCEKCKAPKTKVFYVDDVNKGGLVELCRKCYDELKERLASLQSLLRKPIELRVIEMVVKKFLEEK